MFTKRLRKSFIEQDIAFTLRMIIRISVKVVEEGKSRAFKISKQLMLITIKISFFRVYNIFDKRIMRDKCVQTNLSRFTASDKSMNFLLEIVDIKITDIFHINHGALSIIFVVPLFVRCRYNTR